MNVLWGAGRLLWRVLRNTRPVVVAKSWQAVRGVLPADTRPARRLASAVLAVAVLGSGYAVPLRSGGSALPSSAPAAGIGEAHGSSRLAAAENGRRVSVALDTPGSSFDRRAAPAAGNRTALIIGINNARGGAPLPGSITDATNIRDALLGYGFLRKNITLLTEKEATASAIRHELAELGRRTPADGVAVFAVATHTRRRGGRNTFLTADGGEISATELGAALSKVRSKMWVALPTCFAGGYAVPGVVGRNRVATFASPSSQQTYQVGSAGSYLVINMVREAMLRGHAPRSVEDAFRYARDTLERTHPNRVPIIDDGVKGQLVLGRMSEKSIAEHSTATLRAETRAADPEEVEAQSDPRSSADAAEDEEVEEPASKKGIGVCGGRFSYRCSSDD